MKILKKLLSSDYGMLGVLVALCVFFSLITYENQQPVGQDAADRLLGQIQDQFKEPGVVIIAGKNSEEGRVFVSQLEEQLTEGGWKVEAAIAGSPIDLGKALREADDKKLSVNLLACEQSFADLPLVANMKKSIPGLSQIKVVSPESYGWPNFLKSSNLLNVANQIAVIAIIAIGMTLVIITAGIDLSVGSLIAFSAVICCWIVREWMGGPDTTVLGMIVACMLAIGAC